MFVGLQEKNNKNFGLRIKSWNINGIRSKDFGSKFLQNDFLAEIENYDVVILTETHACGQNLFLPGFISPFRRDRSISKNGRKSFGGIAVFIKECLHSKKAIHKVNNDNPDVIWIKIKKEFLNSNTDLFVACAYLSPINKVNSETTKPLMKRLRSDVEKFCSQGSILIMGDLNARTCSYSDFVNLDVDNLCGDPLNNSNDNFLNERNSEDSKKPCKRGRELLTLCRELDISILNGRTVGDIFGKITCFRSNGCSVVDYGICSNDFHDKISEFKVGNLLPWISDHCPISVSIHAHKFSYLTEKKYSTLSKMPTKYKWDNTSEDSVVKLCTSKQFEIKLKEFLALENTSARSFDLLVQDICKKSNLKVVKTHTNNRKDKAWYNNDCKNTKKELSILTKKIRSSPHNSELRKSFSQKKREYRSLISLSKRNFENTELSKLSNNMRNSRTFWDSFKKFRGDKSSNLDRFSPETVINHFTGLLRSTESCTFTRSTQTGPLDSVITRKEVDNAIKNLKNNKSCGIDGISNEILTCIYNIYPDLFISLFNNILSSGTFPDFWKTSLLSPVHKKGSIYDITNYRGISLTPCISKLFESVLNSRLMQWCLDKKVFSDTQLGFFIGNRTSDAHVILHNLINKYCQKNKKTIFSCFVDFEKAFDRVSRPLLFSKLNKYGVTGYFYNVICSMYCGNFACVKLSNRISAPFPVDIGVRQGCVLSPTLFNIFIADLCTSLTNDAAHGLHLDGKSVISNIIWADDIVLLSSTKEGLQYQLDQLSLFSIENHLTVNINKTKCMCFNKGGRLIKNFFKLGQDVLEDVSSFKYLGFLVTCNGNLGKGIFDLSSRATKAYYMMRTTLGYAFRNSICTTLHLFDSLVKPIILYNSDFWGMCSLSQCLQNSAERLCAKFYKDLLGVSPRTSNAAVRLELARYPISIDAQKHCLNNWLRITSQKRCNPLLLKSCNDSLLRHLEWPCSIKLGMTQGNIGFLWGSILPVLPKSSTVDRFKQNLIDISFKNDTAEMVTKKSKLQLLSKLRYCENYTLPSYLLNERRIDVRILISKLRLSDHCLAIEQGRILGVPRELRMCPICMKSVEDEFHFLFDCVGFAQERELRDLQIKEAHPLFEKFSHLNKFITIFQDLMACSSLGTFLKSAFDKRKALLDNDSILS